MIKIPATEKEAVSRAFVEMMGQKGVKHTFDFAKAIDLTLDPTRWEDLRVPVTAVQKGGLNDPAFTKIKDNGIGSTGVYTYAFHQATEQELFFTVQLPHSYKEGTDLKPHVHWMPINTNTGSVVWGLEYSIASVNGTFGNSLILSVPGAASLTAYRHQILGLGTIPGTGLKVSSMLMCRVFRKAADDLDDYGSLAALLEIDFHYQIDALGSTEELVK